MAVLALGAAGSAIGGSIGGTLFGVTAATLGGYVGGAIGSVIDSWIIGSLQPDQRFEGQRLDDLQVTSATEGTPIPRVYARFRVGGNLIWATDFREEVTTTETGGKGGPSVTSTNYTYSASFAMGVCEGPVAAVGRVWADGKPMSVLGGSAAWRFYLGDEEQEPDPHIESVMGVGEVPAYRGLAYLVFENLPLEQFGNRIPQITVEVFRPVDDRESAEGAIDAVVLGPGHGEFAYAETRVREQVGAGEEVGINQRSDLAIKQGQQSDLRNSFEQLLGSVPGIQQVTLQVGWYGLDLRCGECEIKPGVKSATLDSVPLTWSVNGVSRGSAHLVSQHSGAAAFEGTPSDASIVEAIQYLKSRGKRVVFYPTLLMDVPAGNALPDPYSDNAGTVGQPVYPDRKSITCSPAAGFVGTVDKTAAASGQVDSFFGTATPASFSVSGTSVSWTGPAGEWSLSRMILHYAHLCAQAGGVDAFLVGSQLKGVTQIRSDASTYPAVAKLVTLAGHAGTILGAGAKVSYAADWSEYHGHQPADGSGDVFFHLDSFWSSANCDFVGIDFFMPLSDWRDGFEHLDALSYASIYSQEYLRANVEGGEFFDWVYASDGDRAAQVRTAIDDPVAGKPWVFRLKDIRSWWANRHYNRPGGVESGTPTGWLAQSREIRFTAMGCPAVDRGSNLPGAVLDYKSSASALPYFSRGWRDDAIQRAYIEAVIRYWRGAGVNPVSSVYFDPMIRLRDVAVSSWDVRPYPFFPVLEGVWQDTADWQTGYHLNGRIGSAGLGALVKELCLQAGVDSQYLDTDGLWGAVEGMAIGALEAPRASISLIARHFGFDAWESEGRLKFGMRGRRPVASLAIGDLVEASSPDEEPFEIVRAQETELPGALKWTVTRSDEEYDPGTVEAMRGVTQSRAVSSETFHFATALEEADRRVWRALQEAWVGRDVISASLPPSRLALDPGDVVELLHDARLYQWRLMGVHDTLARRVQGMRHDRVVYDLPPGRARRANLPVPLGVSPMAGIVMDLPQIIEADPAHRPRLAAYSRPWPGEAAVYTSPTEDGYSLLTTTAVRAQIGVSVSSFAAGPTWRFDRVNTLDVEVASGQLASVTEAQVLAGANVFAIEAAPGEWEVFQAQDAVLVGPRQYRLSNLLRGQRGTENVMAVNAPVPAGATVVVLSAGTSTLPIQKADLGLDVNLLVGPAALAFTDPSYTSQVFTPRGIGLRPFSVGPCEQPFRVGRTEGSYTIKWKRRSRDLVADSWGLSEVPLAEESEAYEVEILDAGDNVLRTKAVTAPEAPYSAAQQVTDFGAELGPGDVLRVRIYQISAVFGRGAPSYQILKF